MVNKELRDELYDMYGDDIIFFDNHAYDQSIIGVSDDGRIIYDYYKMVEELEKDEGWSEEDAIDWVEYNTIRGLDYFTDPNKPIIMTPLEM